ncbi:ABC transporter substrate-binding protein, partial [Mesorhizobium sp. M8A.F.Ca.ET.059.01.1.1]
MRTFLRDVMLAGIVLALSALLPSIASA